MGIFSDAVGKLDGEPAPYIYAERMRDALQWLSEHGLVELVPAKGWEKEFELIGGKVVRTMWSRMPSRPS